MRKKLAALGLLALVSTGCARQGALMSIGEAQTKLNDGRRIAIDGFARYVKGAQAQDGILPIEIHGRPGGGEGCMPVNATVGTAADQVETPPDPSSLDSVKLHVHDGSVASSMDKVRISGVLRVKTTNEKETYTLIGPFLVERP